MKYKIYVAAPWSYGFYAGRVALTLLFHPRILPTYTLPEAYNRDGFDVISCWHDLEHHHYSKTGEFTSKNQHRWPLLKSEAQHDLDLIDECDLFFMLIPPFLQISAGSHTEFGYALSKRKRTVVVTKNENPTSIFHLLADYRLDWDEIQYEVNDRKRPAPEEEK